MGEISLESPRQLFERLQARLETERARLRQWQAIEADYGRKYAQELSPLEDKLQQARYKLVLCFDHAYKQMGLSKAEREFVSELVTEFSEELLSLAFKEGLPAGCDVARLKTLYKKHCGSEYDADLAEDIEIARATLIEALELDTDADLAAFKPVQLLQRIQDQYEDEEAEELLELARVAIHSSVPHAAAWQALQESERARLGQVAGNPTSQASPDTTGGAAAADAAATGAAAADAAAADAAAADAAAANPTPVADDRLPEANASLQAELDEILRQSSFAEEGFKLRYALDPFATFDPDTVIAELDEDIVDIQEYIRELDHEVMQFSDPALLKAWLKAMKREIAAIDRREGRG